MLPTDHMLKALQRLCVTAESTRRLHVLLMINNPMDWLLELECIIGYLQDVRTHSKLVMSGSRPS